MREPGQDVRLASEPLSLRRVRERAAKEQLDRDIAVEVEIMSSVHLAHSAGAERLENPVVGKLFTDHGSGCHRDGTGVPALASSCNGAVCEANAGSLA